MRYWIQVSDCNTYTRTCSVPLAVSKVITWPWSSRSIKGHQAEYITLMIIMVHDCYIGSTRPTIHKGVFRVPVISSGDITWRLYFTHALNHAHQVAEAFVKFQHHTKLPSEIIKSLNGPLYLLHSDPELHWYNYFESFISRVLWKMICCTVSNAYWEKYKNIIIILATKCLCSKYLCPSITKWGALR